MAKILFVVHRAFPYPGGSEYYVQDMAEEAQKRGHDVTILADTIGEGNPIKVTNQHQIAQSEDWDLIVVHGADVVTQNIILANAHQISSPVLYMIIKPSDSVIAKDGAYNSTYLGYSTKNDIKHIMKLGMLNKARRVRHGIVSKLQERKKDFHVMNRYNIVSIGGFSPHKGMIELYEAIRDSELKDTVHLHLAGYMDQQYAPPEKSWCSVYKNLDRGEVSDLLRSADIYVMNSFDEGFGLVLLESMLAYIPWFAREGVGAVNDLARFGNVYRDEKEFLNMLYRYCDKTSSFANEVNSKLEKAYWHVLSDHSIEQTIDDIEDIIRNG